MTLDAAHDPFLSVIVCTADRAEHLRRTLDSLARQALPREACEVVVVDDGSQDDTGEVARSFAEKLPLRYSRQRSAGAPSALNHGIFLARGEIVLFLDDDVAADPKLLEVHCDAHRRFPEARLAVLGSRELDPAIAPDPLSRVLHDADRVSHGSSALCGGDVLDFGYFRTGRSSCKRSFLLEHGVFDTSFRFGCEDVELAWRLSRDGFRVVYDSRAITRWLRTVGIDEMCRTMARSGQAEVDLCRLHPEQAVREKTEIADAEAAWQRVGPVHDALVRSARELDRIVRLRTGAGLAVGDGDWPLVERGYWAALRACKLAGIARRSAELGDGRINASAASSHPRRTAADSTACEP